MIVRDVLSGVDRELSKGSVEASRVESEILVSAVLGLLDKPRHELVRSYDRELSTAEPRTLASLVLRRLSGEPVQYIVRRAWFRDLVLEVGPGVLIPRPETEVLAGEVIQWIDGRAARVLDVGTGSGCIALAVAAECSCAHVIAVDASSRALHYARENRDRVESSFPGTAARVEIIEGEGLAAGGPPDARFDVVVSNPPYVSEAAAATLQREVRDHEPKQALYAAAGGFAMLHQLVDGAPERLISGGLLALEVGDGQAEEIAERIEHTGAYRGARVVPDLAGRLRVVLAERK